MGLKERIIEFIDYQEIKPSSFEAKCGISNGAVSKMGENTRVAILDRISNVYPNLNMMWVRTGVGKMILDDNKQEETKTIPKPPITNIEDCICEKQPIIDISVCAGNGVGLTGKENKVIDWVAIPSFKGCTGITVYGDSMFDKYRSGDVIFIRPIISADDIDFGQCYVVVTREDRIMKNIYESNKGDDFVCMTSYNTATNPDGRRVYPDRDIHKSDICFLYKVVGKLERNQM